MNEIETFNNILNESEMRDYNIDISSVKNNGEEMLNAEELIGEALVMEGIVDDWVVESEDYFRERNEYYKNNPPNEEGHGDSYESDPIWMAAQRDTLRHLVSLLTEDALDNFFGSGRYNDYDEEQKAAFDKVVRRKNGLHESVVDWTSTDDTVSDLDDAVKKILEDHGYEFGGDYGSGLNPKTYYTMKAYEGQILYLVSVKGEYYDEIAIQINRSKISGMSNYTIKSPEDVLWMGQSVKELKDDIGDMETGYNEF